MERNQRWVLRGFRVRALRLMVPYHHNNWFWANASIELWLCAAAALGPLGRERGVFIANVLPLLPEADYISSQMTGHHCSREGGGAVRAAPGCAGRHRAARGGAGAASQEHCLRRDTPPHARIVQSYQKPTTSPRK